MVKKFSTYRTTLIITTGNVFVHNYARLFRRAGQLKNATYKMNNINGMISNLRGPNLIMKTGMKILRQNNLPIGSETRQTYELYNKLFEIMNNPNKKNQSEQ